MQRATAINTRALAMWAERAATGERGRPTHMYNDMQRVAAIIGKALHDVITSYNVHPRSNKAMDITIHDTL